MGVDVSAPDSPGMAAARRDFNLYWGQTKGMHPAEKDNFIRKHISDHTTENTPEFQDDPEDSDLDGYNERMDLEGKKRGLLARSTGWKERMGIQGFSQEDVVRRGVEKDLQNRSPSLSSPGGPPPPFIDDGTGSIGGPKGQGKRLRKPWSSSRSHTQDFEDAYKTATDLDRLGFRDGQQHDPIQNRRDLFRPPGGGAPVGVNGPIDLGPEVTPLHGSIMRLENTLDDIGTNNRIQRKLRKDKLRGVNNTL